MDANTKRNLELRREVKELGCEIANDIEHGECFYEESMLKEFLSNLDKLRDLTIQYYKSNRAED